MPTQYVIDVDRHLVLTSFSGILTLEEMLRHIGALRRDSGFKAEFSELVDLGSAAEVRLGYSDFQHLAGLDPFSPMAKRAFVVPREGAILGVTRMFQIIRENPKIQIFHSTAEALDWLERPE